MHYVGRPAWRNYWFDLTVALLFVLLTLAAFAPQASFPGSGSIPQLPPRLAGFLDDLPPWAAALGLLPAAVFLVRAALRRYMWRFSITDVTIESRHGIIARDVNSIRVRDLRNVNFHQSFAQRIFGLGNVEFSTAGGDGIEVTFPGVSRPARLKRQVRALQASVEGEAETDP